MTTDEFVDEVFGRCQERIARGEVVDVDEVVRAHPDLADALRERFAAARLLDRAGARERHDATAAATRVGSMLGGYRIESVLGSGGMGTVYLASVPTTGERVALKVFHPPLETRERFGARFVREAELGRRVRHANVVRTLDAFEAMEADRPVRVLVMEYVEGRTLRDLLVEMGCRETVRKDRRDPPPEGHVLPRSMGLVRPVSHGLPEELVRHVGREVAKGLAAIHAAGAVHRDLKPENVMICRAADRDEAERRSTPPKGGDEFEGNVIISRCAATGDDHVAERPGAVSQGRTRPSCGRSRGEPRGSDGHVDRPCDHVVKVMDLGVAHVEDAATLSETGAFVGSLRYGAPEQVNRRGEVDARADLHALGLLLHELATGAQAFEGEDFGELVRQILEFRPRRIGELAPQVSPFLDELVAQLLEKDRERRPAGAEMVASILAQGEESAWWRERTLAIRRETKRPLRRIRIPRETVLYGRDAEISRLRGLFEKAKAGDGQVVLVEGEAGIGKSRLVDEFVQSLRAAGEDIDFLFGSYPPGGAASAAGAFSTAYREHLGDDEALLREALPQTPLLVPAFAALLRGDAAPEGAERLTKDSIQTCFVHATRSFAARRTTIVLVDDLHFAPEEGRALFASLALAVPGHRVLLLGGARPSLEQRWATDFARLPNASRVALQRLSPKELVALLKDALRSEHLATDLAGKIGEKSDGNPYFIFEILRGLREGNFVTRRPDGTWVTTRSIREIEVPPSIVEVIHARVLDLREAERNVLEVASCVGFEFDAALVGAVLGVAPIPLLQGLGRIEKAHRMVRSVGHVFAFDHHQVQEVLYAGLSPPLREAYHAAIAEAIEAKSGAAEREPPDLDGALCVDLAEHFLRGTNAERGLRYVDAALGRLESRWLHDDALRLCRRALAVPGLVGGATRCVLLLRAATRLGDLGRAAEQEAPLDEARAIADGLGAPPLRIRVRDAWSRHLVLQSRFADAEASLREALVIAGACGAGDSGLRVTLATTMREQGRIDDARRELDALVAQADAAGDADVGLRAAVELGITLLSANRYEEAREVLTRVLDAERLAGDVRRIANATGQLGIVLLSEGRMEEALERFAESLRGMRETGSRGGEATFTGNFAVALCDLGRLDEALPHFERALSLAREIGNRALEGYWLYGLGVLAEEQRRDADAEDRLRAAIDLRREIGHRAGEAHGRLFLGRLLARTGRNDEAAVELREACAIARTTGTPETEVAALALLAAHGGDVAAAEGELARLRDHVAVCVTIEPRMDLFRATGKRTYLAEAKAIEARLLALNPGHHAQMLALHVHRDVAAAVAEHGL